MSAAAQDPPEVADLGYEQARDELVDVVRRLEAGSATLEESLQLWERGQALAARCEQWLAGARARVDALTAPMPDPPTGRADQGAQPGVGPA